MDATVNGQSRTVGDGLSLQQFLTHDRTDTRGCAAAVDGVAGPRARWAAVVLVDGQSVEVLTAVQGG
jgi:thiamine biosynthesis protein ThiS